MTDVRVGNETLEPVPQIRVRTRVNEIDVLPLILLSQIEYTNNTFNLLNCVNLVNLSGQNIISNREP